MAEDASVARDSGVRRLGGSYPATPLHLKRVNVIAFFALMIAILFNPLSAAAQIRCEPPAGSIVSAEGEISILGRAGGLLQPVAAGAEARLCPGESVVVGPRSRAALRLQDTGQVIRLDQGTTLRVLPARRRGRPLLNLARGIIQLFSPGNRPLDVQTPFVTAGVEGTEF
ncbi:MAG: FecR domain-containing protein, partial [Acetobacteraceae bacterium]|nr:FecR domain-containing protein [Acetobacteraceae bacterium]